MGLAVVGSYARGDASDTSDVDLVLLTTDKDKLLNNSDWLQTFAAVKDAVVREYGNLISIHTEYEQLPEIEFGVCDVSWADVPLDSGTKEVILGGIKVLYDVNQLLERAVLDSIEIDSIKPSHVLRTSCATDADFAYHVVKTTMQNFALQTWGVWLDEKVKKDAATDTRDGKIQIIYLGSEKAGTLQVEETESKILVKQLYLLPQFQKRGIGSEIISDLKKKSKCTLLPIGLSVLAVNSAREFYLQHGFTVRKETSERIQMIYIP